MTRLKTACGTPDYSKAPLLYAEAAKFIVYTGHDRARKYKSGPTTRRQKTSAESNSVCERINNRVAAIDAWGEILTQRKRDQNWYAIEGQHTFRKRIRKVIFAFVEIEGKLYLGDISLKYSRLISLLKKLVFASVFSTALDAQLNQKPSPLREPKGSRPDKPATEIFSLPQIKTRADFDLLQRTYAGTRYAIPHILFVIDRSAQHKVY